MCNIFFKKNRALHLNLFYLKYSSLAVEKVLVFVFLFNTIDIKL
jgi:hypothetical protein